MLKVSLRIIKYLLVLSPFLIVLSFTPFVFAQEESNTGDDIKLFVSSTCSHCENLLNTIDDYPEIMGLEFDIYDVSLNEANSELYDEYLNVCKQEERYVPILYVNGTCYVNSSNVFSKLALLAGIEVDDSDAVTPDTDVSEIEEVTDDTAEDTSQNQDFHLSDLIKNDTSQTKIPFYAYIIIAIAIGSFVGIAYLLINKMKV